MADFLNLILDIINYIEIFENGRETKEERVPEWNIFIIKILTTLTKY